MALPACNAPPPESGSRGRSWVGLGALVLVLAALAVAWRVGPLREWANESQLAEHVSAVTSSRFGPLAAVALFTLLTTLMVPLMAMVAATAIALPLDLAVPVSIGGALLSASIAFTLGRSRCGRRIALRLATGERARRAFAAFGNTGVLAMAGVRLVPVAPFTVVNLAAGLCGVPLRSFLLGTLIGLAPGIAVLSLAANRALGDGAAAEVAALFTRPAHVATAPAQRRPPPSPSLHETSP